MAHKPLTRWLAPSVVLILMAVAWTLVLSAGADRGAGSPGPAERPVRPAGPRIYRVRSGESLSSISISTDVPLARLQRLNRTQDLELRPGQRIKLRPIRR